MTGIAARYGVPDPRYRKLLTKVEGVAERLPEATTPAAGGSGELDTCGMAETRQPVRPKFVGDLRGNE